MCGYCRTHEITPESQTALLSVAEWMTILEAFARLGIRTVRLTGGEPMLYPRLEELISRIHDAGYFEDIAMTTNGSYLAGRAEALRRAGLRRVNISLDTIDARAFDEKVGRVGQLPAVLAGIAESARSGLKVKINTVLTDTPSDEGVARMLAFMSEGDLVWRCIEYMPFNGLRGGVPTFSSWKRQLERVAGGPLIPIHKSTGPEGLGPATYYRLPAGQVIGFIFPMSHSYCDSCNRVRMTSDGKLRLCLLRDDESDLISLVRNGATAAETSRHIVDVLQLRREEHEDASRVGVARGMWRIGG